MYTYPYQILKQRLLATVTELRIVDWYLDQDSLADARLVAAPAAFIEFLPTDTETFAGQKIQQSKAILNIHLITECVMDDDKRMKKDQASDHMRIFDKVYKYIQGFSAKISYLPTFSALVNTPGDQRAFASLSRVAIVPPHRPTKALMKTTQQFTGLFYDHGGAGLYEDPGTPALEVVTDFILPGG